MIPKTTTYITVPAPCGDIRGKILPSGIEEYLGIPYAKAERFCPPRPASWSDRRDCMQIGEMAPQPNFLGEKPEGVDLTIQGSEDCLTLNVWAQPGTVSRGLPVIVYIHGGGFQVGSNGDPRRTGSLFIQKEPLIFVSVNYRLGVLGYLGLEGEMAEKYPDAGNCGALDVMCAIKWVHDNIEAFGGNPERIFLLGISAGAKMIGCLLTHPKTAAMIHGVILESGAMQSFHSAETAKTVGREYRKVLREQNPDTPEEKLLALPMERLLIAQAAFCDVPGSTCWFGPVLDDRTFKKDWLCDWNAGKGWKGKAMLGSCAREMHFMAERADFAERKDEILTNLFGDNAPLVQERFDRLEANSARGTENWVKVMSDFMYRSYTDRLAMKLSYDGCRVWVYSFQYGAAGHGMGFSYLMHDLRKPGEEVDPAVMLERRRVAREMRGMIRRFVTAGAPEEPHRWPEYSRKSGYVKMIFDAVPHTESRPRDVLDGYPEMVYVREDV